MHQIQNGRITVFLALSTFAKEVEIDLRCIRPTFLEHLTTSLRWIDIPFLTITSKIFNWVRSPFEVSELQDHREVDCTAEQLIELQNRQL